MKWHTNAAQIAANIPELLMVPSLTFALQQKGQLSVQLCYIGATEQAEAFADQSLPVPLFMREVILRLDGQPMIRAQSFCQAHGIWAQLIQCGQTPLGEVLFSGQLHGLTRSVIEFSQWDKDKWARRSWFDLQSERLYLIEYFLRT